MMFLLKVIYFRENGSKLSLRNISLKQASCLVTIKPNDMSICENRRTLDYISTYSCLSHYKSFYNG